MTFLSRHFDQLLATDWSTIIVIAILCGLAAVFLKEYLAKPPMVIFVYPMLVLFTVLIQYTFSCLELFAPKKLDEWLMWTILAAIIGNFVGIVVAAGGAILIDRLTVGRRAVPEAEPPQRPRRVQGTRAALR